MLHNKKSSIHSALRRAVCLVICVVFIVAAWTIGFGITISLAADDLSRSANNTEFIDSKKNISKHITILSSDGSGADDNRSAPIKLEDFILSLPRGKQMNMFNLTQTNDCDRPKSWRWWEKRYLRLERDRGKMKDCQKATHIPLTELFGLFVANETDETVPQAKDYTFRHPEDNYPADADDAWNFVHKAVGSNLPLSEKHRLYSLATIAMNDFFKWNSDFPSTPQSFKDLVRSGRIIGKTVSSLRINPDALQECSFSRFPSFLEPDFLSPFSIAGYDLVQFLFEEAFLRYGWVSLPVAGTALGALRHQGMFRYDDDMDIISFAPPEYLLRQSEWMTIYAEFDRIVENYATRVRQNFSWFQANLYKNRNGTTDAPPWYSPRDLKKGPPPFSFMEYPKHIKQNTRVCLAQYMTSDGTDKRRLFQTEGCVPNHWFLCLQPSQYLYEQDASEFLARRFPPAVEYFAQAQNLSDPTPQAVNGFLFTNFHKRPMGKLCKCRFGKRSGYPNVSTDYRELQQSGGLLYSLCPENLVDFVVMWYDQFWCVQTGAVASRKWSFLKSWTD